jgi:NAD(P)-dependent dehydrogenase (short-subunit alcohol dehydrogenase family)
MAALHRHHPPPEFAVSSPSAPFDLPGQVLVQGASRGIGAAFVEALLNVETVTAVIATSRDPTVSTALNALHDAHGPQRLQLLSMDITDEVAIRDAAGRLDPGDTPLRMIVNCAGLLHDDGLVPEKRLEDLNDEHLHRVFAVNCFGPMLVARYFQPLLARRGRTVFASISARVGSITDNRLGGWYAYRASKAAQNMFTRTLAIELARRLPDCLCVGLHPGTVETDLSAPFRRGVSADRLFTPAYAAERMIDVVAGLGIEASGNCFAWDGKPIAP